MSYSATVLADSISPDDVRLTTLLVTFPRFILAELNTHRMFSRNSASSRAIPTEKLIERVLHDPFVPETFNLRVKGMGVGDALVGDDASVAEEVWRTAIENAVGAAEGLLRIDCDKSRANRLLEPFMWHTAIVSATEWDNFFALRDHRDAQPEFRITAQAMRLALDQSEPQPLDYGWWHLPMLAEDELANLCTMRRTGDERRIRQWVEGCKLVSAGRLARVSFDTHTRMESRALSIERAVKLMNSGHFSPFEHVARPVNSADTGDFAFCEPHDDPAQVFVGNFRGWVQMRKEIPHEARFDLALAEAAA